ncbi:uncharacterized protein LOC135812958 [Sycon ciliatum]|uniref:uncharacterized protein LOC135812958 n=1 Tax=Sycon ciliatum TaxID=27933 RepID=UPI0031F63C68
MGGDDGGGRSPMGSDASSPFWTELASIRNPAVQHLVDALPVVLLNDVAPSTGRAYLQAFGCWRTWASGAGFTSFPARAVHVALNLTSLIQQGTTFAPVVQGCAALRWLHRKAGHPDPIAAPVITQLQVAARRICARPVSRRTPISPSLFRQLMSTLAQPEAPLGDLQCATMICLGFFALLRWDDLQRLVVSSLDFTPTHMSVHLPSRKNDQLRQGDVILVARQFTGSMPCPVRITESFLRQAGHSPDQHVLGKVTSARSGPGVRGTMSYSRATELLKVAVGRTQTDATSYGLHSLRSGGATAAANSGIADRLLQRHGGWRSASSKDKYIADSQHDLLSVSTAIASA